jgi:alpha-galactosidase
VQHRWEGFLAILAMCLMAMPAENTEPASEEIAQAGEWFAARFTPDQGAVRPFSFVYDGKESATLLSKWKLEGTSRNLDANRTERTLVYTDPQTGLVLRCVALEYHDFPMVEWTLWFKNAGSENTPILENIQALDTQIERGESGEFLLHHNRGSVAAKGDYEPFETVLSPSISKRISAAGGRPTNSDMSYFNVEWPDGGRIVVVGWPGQWAAEFARDAGKGLRIRAGQELTHFRLRPGEEVRSPLMVLQFYRGDWIRAQNIWRRWMIAHNLPRPSGKLPPFQLAASSSRQYGEMIHANEENQKMFIDRYVEEGIKLDYWWMDAGWYVNKTGWPNTGTWEVDMARFPRGLRAVSDYAHSKGVKTIVWFEPERVTAGSWLADNHPEWILGGKNGGLLNLGNKEAWDWLVNHVDNLLTEQGIDLYRQDFNIDPLNFWRGNDAEDRQGITEIYHVMGYLAYWDELLRRRPNLLIDSCASGGRRNDLETMRRAVPLWRSDYAFEPIGTQCHTYGISFWLPFSGAGTVALSTAPYYGSGKTAVDAYAFRSNVCPSTGCGIDMREREIDYAALRRLIEQWREHIAPNYYGDYYPLTPYSQETNAWMAWQFDRPEDGRGVVQVFRRQDSPTETMRLPLRGLRPEASYIVTDLDGNKPERTTGKQLMNEGLTVTLPLKPAAAVFTYKRGSE